MLKAIIHSKAGRVEHEGEGSVRWADVFKHSEDLMTAAVFSRFSYLSTNVQNHFLQQWLGCDHNFTDFQEIEFWPSYQLTLKNKKHKNVEPDLVLRFESSDLIIEVKPPAGGDQKLGQWQEEIESFLESNDQGEKPLFFLAIGRIESGNAIKWINNLKNKFGHQLHHINALKWQPLTDSILELQKSDTPNPQDQRILNDITEALNLYGLKVSSHTWSSLVNNTSLCELSLNHPALQKHTHHNFYMEVMNND
jgi:hypothetical protein